MGKSGARRKGGSVLGTPSPKKFKPAKFQEIFDAMKSYKGILWIILDIFGHLKGFLKP